MNKNHLSRLNPDMKLRAPWWNYRGKATYMITIMMNTDFPSLSHIYGKKDSSNKIYAKAIPNEIGKIIELQLHLIRGYFDFAKVLKYAIMPDHIHFVINISKETNFHLSDIIRDFKSKCTYEYNKKFPNSHFSLNRISIFDSGYNDKIVNYPGKYQAFMNYVQQNPYRYYIKKNHPEYFNNRLYLDIDGYIYLCFGNILLLKNPSITCVRYSSKYSDNEICKLRNKYKETIRNNGVYVSPFIHTKEKYIRDIGIEKGIGIIKIERNGLCDRYKPSGLDFELCADGRLLIIAPIEYRTSLPDLDREECMAMNELAQRISDGGIIFKIIHEIKEHKARLNFNHRIYDSEFKSIGGD